MINKIIIGASLAGVGMGTVYVLKLRRLSKEIEVITNVSISNADLNGLQLKIEVQLKNPTSTGITMKYPFVKMLYNNKTFASSDIKNTTYTLPAHGEKQIDPIYITIGFLSLASLSPDLLAQYRKEGKVTITVNTVTTIDGFIPYSKTQTSDIGE